MTPAKAPESPPQAPAAGPFSAEQRERLEAWTRRYPTAAMGLIEALRDVQDWHGRVTREDEDHLAGLFQVPAKRVHELVTFYPYFPPQPAGKFRVYVCRNVSCHLAGAEAVLERLAERFGEPYRASPDGLFSYEPVECLGACEMAPAFSVNDELQGRATPERLDAALERAAKTGEVVPAPVASCAQAGAHRRLFTAHFDDAALHTLTAYKGHGGYAAWAKAKTMAPEAITEEVKKSNLRGLGGAGFPVGMKWSTVPPKSQRQAPHYVVANFDESEPGCFKDRSIVERDPHSLIEGLLITGRAVSADGLFIFIRGEYRRQYAILNAAIEEARSAGLLDDTPLLVMRGANAYISGLDTALLETMEGKKAWPRQPPPFPTAVGLNGHPTVVNNVETLMMVPKVLALGAEAFAALGAPKCGGTAVYSVSGHVEKPGIYELPQGAPFADLLAAAGGVKGGRKLKALIPGGTSTPVLTADEAMKLKLDFESVRAAGSFLGAGGVIVLDETTDMSEVCHIIERFLHHESCGQCTPCREGSGWVERILERVVEGRGAQADLDNVLRIGGNISGTVICALGETVGPVAKTMMAKFPEDFKKKVAPRG